MQAVAAVVQKLLPILDNFERAAQAIKPQTPGEAAVVQQYSGLQAELEAVLRQYGVEEMRCEGLPFDPMVHEAVMQEFSDEVWGQCEEEGSGGQVYKWLGGSGEGWKQRGRGTRRPRLA